MALTKVDFSDANVGMTDEQIQESVTPKSLELDKWYKGRIVEGAHMTITSSSGNTALTFPVMPVDEAGIERKPKMNVFITMPWITDPNKLEQAGLSRTHQVDIAEAKGTNCPPNTSFLLLFWGRALLGPEEVPEYPRKNKDTGEIEFKDGTLDTWEEANQIKTEIARTVDIYFQEVAKNPELLVGTEFYFQVQDQVDQYGEPSGYKEIKFDTSKAGRDTLPKKELSEDDVLGTF